MSLFLLLVEVGVCFFGALGLLPPWGVRLIPDWLWFVVGVCLLALWGFCSPWGVRLLPLGGCVGVCLLALRGFCLR